MPMNLGRLLRETAVRCADKTALICGTESISYRDLDGEKVVAFVSVRSAVSEEELREFASIRLADYKVPERITFLKELPKGITGKVQRRELKEMAASA